MPQLLTCSSQLLFLLYFISLPCDLRRGKKTRKTSWLMVYGHSETAVIGVTLSTCAFAIADRMFSFPPATTVQASGMLGAESCLGAAGPAPTGRTALFALSRYFSAILTVDIWTYFGGCVAAAPKPVPTGLLSLWPVSLPGSQAGGCSLYSANTCPVHPRFSYLWGALLSVRIPMSKLGSVLETGGRRAGCEPTEEVPCF